MCNIDAPCLPDFFQSMAHFRAAVFHKAPKQLQDLIQMR